MKPKIKRKVGRPPLPASQRGVKLTFRIPQFIVDELLCLAATAEITPKEYLSSVIQKAYFQLTGTKRP